MNKNLFRWMFLGLLSFAAVTFVGCKDDDTQDIQMPTLSVSVSELTFDEAGGRQVVDITSNCNWTVVKPDWVTVTPAAGSNNGQIEVAATETTTPRTGRITFELSHPEWGKWGKAEASISLTQTVAGEQPAPETVDEAKYYNFTKVTELQPNKWYAIVGDHNGTMKAGTTQSNNYGYMSAMAVTVANDAFKAMGTAAFYFEADGDNVKIKMTNGKYLYQTGDYDSFQYGTAPENNWLVEAQADGTFKITNNETGKYVQMDSQYGSYGCYTAVKGTMPYLFALGSEAEPPKETPAITIAELLAMENGAVPEGTVIEGVVISGELGNLTSLKTVYLQDETAAVQLYFAADTDYKRGDKLKVNLTGAQRAEYNGAQQVSGVVNAQAEVLSQNNEITAKSVSMADFMANKYESQYIAVEGVQVAESELEKTWGNKDDHTSIKIVDAEGNYFYVFSSKFATYKDQTVAQGSGVIKGIASISTNGMQLIFSTESDWAGLTGERFEEKTVELELEGDGLTVETAYTLVDLQTLYNAGQNPTGVWVKGTIAGCYENSGLTDEYVASNLALQTGEVVVPVALPSKSDIRTALNLVDNPTNLNKEVAIKGDITKYFSVAGLKNTTEYQFIEGSTEPEPEPEPELAQGPFTSQWPFALLASNSTNGYSMTKSDGTNSTANGLEASGFKLGTGSKAGYVASQPINVAGDNTLTFYALAWNGTSATLYVRVDGGAATSFELASNEGVASSEPYTLTNVYTTSKYTMELTGLTAESVIEFSTSANFTNESNSSSGRAVVFGVNLANAPADQPEPEYTKATLAEATEDGVKYEVEATVAGKNNVSLLIADATGTTLIYLGAGKTGDYTIGDTVTVQGEMETYYNLRQFKSTSLVTVKAAGTYNYPAVTEATAEMINAYNNNKAYDYVAVTGTLACEVSGSYTNYYLTVEGANGRVQVYRPLSDQETELKSLDGHNVTVTGYFVGTWKDDSAYFPNLMMLQILDNGLVEDGGDDTTGDDTTGDDTTGDDTTGDDTTGGEVTGTVATFDFTAMGYTETTDMTTQTIESNGVTIVFGKGTNSSNAPKYYTNGEAIRFYGGNEMTFSGKTITKIDFTFDASNMKNNISMTPGTYTQASDNASGTWEGSATEVAFTTDGTSGNNRIKSIVVTFEE